MCGILTYAGNNTLVIEDEWQEFDEEQLKAVVESKNYHPTFSRLIPYIIRRGPNYGSIRCISSLNLMLFSSVLSLRNPFTKQSLVIDGRFILQYNGELYGDDVNKNDTQYISTLLSKFGVVTTIKLLRGEFAYSIVDQKEKKLFFGRDCIGRRSLSFSMTDGQLFVSSVTGRLDGFKNCIGGIIYMYDLTSNELDASLSINENAYSISDTIDKNLGNLEANVFRLYNCLCNSVEQRLSTIHPLHKENFSVAVLFSGGLDCSVLVAILCELMMLKPPQERLSIELLNVSFENPRTGKDPTETPDRLLALRSSELLKHRYPEIEIYLVKIDVMYDEYLSKKEEVIDLIYPKNTEMDLSIAIAFYFASRGKGIITFRGKDIPYNRKSIVLFSGLGADELYGGYHKFSNKNHEELVTELELQIRRIHDRNLNRDDKVMANQGIEVRYPYLDEEVVDLSTKLPINYKINKMVLRSLAASILNLDFISEEPKRAIQFGARSAKMTKDSGKSGTDIVN